MLRLLGHLDRWNPHGNVSTRLTEYKWAKRNGDVKDHIAEHHLQTKHQIDWDSTTCITYCTDYHKRFSLEIWFTTGLGQKPMNRGQQLPAPYKRLIDGLSKQTTRRMTGQLKIWLTINDCFNCDNTRIEAHQWHYESSWPITSRLNRPMTNNTMTDHDLIDQLGQ